MWSHMIAQKKITRIYHISIQMALRKNVDDFGIMHSLGAYYTLGINVIQGQLCSHSKTGFM